MTPQIQINFMALITSVIACFLFGFIWYTPLFGKLWGKEMGHNPNETPPASMLMKGMLFMVIGNFLMVWVFAHNMAVWNPITWGQPASEIPPFSNALMASVFTWLGFYFPGELGNTVWEKKSWTVFFINSGHQFLSLFITALILSYW